VSQDGGGPRPGPSVRSGGREQISTEALVLTSADVRDDRIVHLLTPDRGRQPVVAKHARKSLKRFGGHLQPLTHIKAILTLHEGRDLGRLDSATEQATFSRLKGDLDRFARASVIIDVVTHLIPPHGHEPGVFELLGRALTHLDTAEDVGDDVLALFELRMLRGLGILPDWDAIAGLPEAAGPVLDGWLESRWDPLPEGTLAATVTALERLIQDASGRVLKSRGVLEELLGR